MQLKLQLLKPLFERTYINFVLITRALTIWRYYNCALSTLGPSLSPSEGECFHNKKANVTFFLLLTFVARNTSLLANKIVIAQWSHQSQRILQQVT